MGVILKVRSANSMADALAKHGVEWVFPWVGVIMELGIGGVQCPCTPSYCCLIFVSPFPFNESLRY